MRRKMKWRVLASACAAAMAVTSLPYMATQVNAEPAAVTQQTGDNDLKLWYTSPADITKYYEGWQEKSLPIGNGAIGGTVFGGITRERIQLMTNRFGQEDQAPADRITMEVTWRTREITERL